MSVHIFSVTEENYNVCIQHGLVGMPEPKENRTQNKTLQRAWF